ncbi:MAG: hypothetical protein ABIP13_03885 [Tepidiformaceae bacterium]
MARRETGHFVFDYAVWLRRFNHREMIGQAIMSSQISRSMGEPS